MEEINKIRNFCIIAHIDHGKSTLADRMLEITNTVEERNMKKQLLDQMELERERGITIKLQPVRMEYQGYILNLIDTPGHVDFTYEVSRSLAAVEGALLLVDASQGIEAQTLANLYLALEQNLEIIPVINKIDLPAADIKKVSKEIIHLLGCSEEDILYVSAKTGRGVEKVLDNIIKKIKAPKDSKEEVKALIFDSNYDEFKGVVIYTRIFSGFLKKGDKIILASNKEETEVLDIGYFKPHWVSSGILNNGEIGYIITGIKDLAKAKVGDTIFKKGSNLKALPGYKEVKPMVYAGIFTQEGNEYKKLREAILKLKLSDASLIYEPTHSQALGFGFRCGFLGLLHLEISQERLKREFNLDLIVTTPTVAYYVYLSNKKKIVLTTPIEMPDPSQIDYIEEPYMNIEIITPKEYVGNLMPYIIEEKGIYKDTE